MVFVSAVCFINGLSWLNKPFAGFLVYHPPFVNSLGIRDWPGKMAGLKYLDHILSIDEQPVLQGEDVVRAVRQKQPGTPVRYRVESKKEIREVTVVVTIFGIRDFLLVFLITYSCGVLLYALGVIAYLLKPDIRSSWVFLGLCFSLGTYVASAYEIESTYYLVRLHYCALAFFPATFLHLGLIFPDRKRLLDRLPALQCLVYLPAVILSVLYMIYFSTFKEILGSGALPKLPGYSELGAMVRVFSLFSAIILFIFLVHAVYKATTTTARQRARMILFGVAVAFVPPGLAMAAVQFLKANIPWNFLVFFVVFFPASIAYSIIRHNLFDADAIIKRTMGYVVVTAVVVGFYVLVSIFFNVFLGQYQVSQSKAFPIVFTLIIILIFNPLRNRIQSFVDRIFFRKEYDYGEIIHRIGGAMTSLLDLGQVLKQLVRPFMEDMFIDTSSVMLLSTTGTGYQVYAAVGERKEEVEKVLLRRDQPVVRIIEKEKRELTKYDVLEDPKYKAVCEDCARDFETLHASLMVPLVFQDEVVGVINLGEKKSGKSYNREDIDLLRTLANQGAVAIKNARLVDQMKSEEKVRANLARYLSPQIVDQVIKKDVHVNLGGDRKVVAVLFSDIRNFTRISESLPPDQLVQLLNEYFTEMARIIFQNQGSLDKYIGDAIVAVFGSLVPLDNSSKTAVQAAINMMKHMGTLNEKWKNQYGFRMEMGIGINTGDVFLGNVGSPERMEFTVIGDTVNIASRFSGVAKGGQILITKETLGGLTPDMKYAELPPVTVKGKTVELKVFEVLY